MSTSTVTITYKTVTIKNSIAGTSGGHIYLGGTNAVFTATTITFDNNKANS